jgi:pimeloyl-ACP methyl ester carboxylesterase
MEELKKRNRSVLGSITSFICGALLLALSLLPAVSQTPQGDDAKAKAAKKGTVKNMDQWPWVKLHPLTPPYEPTAAEKQQIQAKLGQLDAAIRELETKHVDHDLLADVAIYAEAARWKLFYPIEFFKQQSVGDTLKVLDKGLDRAAQLKYGKSPWTTQKGRVDRGFWSALDGTVQPLRVTVPDDYDGVKPVPLDVAQHGRFTTLYEVETLSGNSGMEIQYLPGTLQIDLFGRGRNTYHWAGEADTFEAIAFAKKAYKIDPERMTLRGFSMGGAGLWHTSLHFPDLWAAVEVGAGNNTSHRIPILNTLPPTYQAMCMIFDNMYQWAINAYDIPFISYVGENDGNRVTHESARQQLVQEGIGFEGEPFTLKATNAPFMMFIIGPNIGHGMNKDSRQLMNGFLYDRIKLGRQVPDHIRFATYTMRYNRDYWVTLDGMGKHYERAEIDAKRSDNRADYDIATKNLTRLVLRQTDHASTVNIDGEKLKVKAAPELALEKTNGAWKLASLREKGLHKRHGMQGPIDDAFLEPFLVIRPTGTPWNAAANDQALRMLQRFDRQYSMVYRGHIRVKDDKDVTADDFAKYNVVLFGDPGSNRWIARLNGKLPLHWTKDTVALGSKSFPANESVPALIYPDPLNANHYVVINSGLTPDWKEWAGDFPTPRYGDFAIFQVKEGTDDPEALYAGLFDESWKIQ